MDSLNKAIRRTLLKLGGAASLTDAQLLAQFVATGEQAAFEETVRRHGPMVLRVCQRVLQHTQDAEDAFQAVFIVLARQAAAVARMVSVGGWLHGVAYRTALNAKKQRARRQATATQGREQKLLEDGLPQSADADTMGQELRALLDEEVHRLPEKYRLTVVLCHLQGKTSEEAAQLLHCETGAVKMRLSRARDLLRDRLARRGLALSAATLVALLAQEATVAALPVRPVTALVQAAALLAAGNTLETGFVTDRALELANALTRDTTARKLRWAVGLLLVLGGAGATLALAPPWGRSASARALPAEAQHVEMRRGSLPFRRAAFSTDSRLVALADVEGGVEIYEIDYEMGLKQGWDPKMFKMRLRLDQPGARRSCLAFAPGGKKLAVGFLDGAVQLWDLAAAGSRVVTLRSAQGGEVTHLAFSPDGKALVALVSGKKAGLTTWTLSSQTVQWQVALADFVAVHLVFTPHNELLAIGEDYLVRSWDAATGREIRVDMPVLPAAITGSRALALTADGSVVVVCNDRSVRLCQRTTNHVRYLFTLPDQAAKLSFLAGPGGDTIACHFHDSNRVVIWDVALNKELCTIERPFEGGISCLAYSPDGKKFFWSGLAEEFKPGMPTVQHVGGIIDVEVKRKLASTKDK